MNELITLNIHVFYLSPFVYLLIFIELNHTQSKNVADSSGDLEIEEVIQSDVVIEVMKLQEAWIDFLKKVHHMLSLLHSLRKKV